MPWTCLGRGFGVLVALVALGSRPAAAQTGGIVVDQVEKGGAAEQAGLEPEDLLQSWERAATPPANPAPASGSFASPFDLPELEVEQRPRGTVGLRGTRDGRPLAIVMSPDWWHVDARPVLTEARLRGMQRLRF